MKGHSTAKKRPERGTTVHGGAHEMSLSIPSSLAAVERVCEEIRKLLEQHHLGRAQFAVEVLARECLNNAILHGNQGVEDGRVSFGMHIGRKLIWMRIGDQGPGFNWRRMRRRLWPSSRSTDGRGLMLATLYAERIAFNRSGNQVTLWINKGQEGR